MRIQKGGRGSRAKAKLTRICSAGPPGQRGPCRLLHPEHHLNDCCQDMCHGRRLAIQCNHPPAWLSRAAARGACRSANPSICLAGGLLVGVTGGFVVHRLLGVLRWGVCPPTPPCSMSVRPATCPGRWAWQGSCGNGTRCAAATALRFAVSACGPLCVSTSGSTKTQAIRDLCFVLAGPPTLKDIAAAAAEPYG